MGELAITGGIKAVQRDPRDVFTWPILTEEDENAVLEVLRSGTMSELDVTQEFEKELAVLYGMKYALAHNNGTAALHAAMFGCEVGVGDEVICPSLTYWASALPALSLGATIIFAEVNPNTVVIDPADIERRITDRTKAIVAVHYQGYPCDMDSIVDIASKHRLKVIEDSSQGIGSLYKGRLVGTFGDVTGISLMSGKTLASGEGGIMITNDRKIYERALAFGHYRRTMSEITDPSLKPYVGLPLGGYKYRMHQLSAALARVQLKYLNERIAQIDKAMNYFWDLLEDTPGIRAIRPSKDSGSTMGGWYAARGLYIAEELGGLSIHKFCEAVRAEGGPAKPGHNPCLHLHPLLNQADVYGHGRPTRIANCDRDVRQPKGSLPISESMPERIFSIPEFKQYYPEIIEEYATAYRKVAENADKLLD